VEVLDGTGKLVHGKTLLSTVRVSYEEVVEQPDRVREALSEQLTTPSAPPSVRHDDAPAPTPDRPTKAVTRKSGSEPLGFEATLWAAADKLHGSMDSSE